jgi:D-erythro-7,8-dihydroneopterin triphosphate epimerase
VDKIYIKDMLVRCVIGVFEDERREKQDVVINVVMHADLSEAGRTDDIKDSVDYKAIKKRILKLVEGSKFFLVEALAEAVAALCLEDGRVARVDVLVEKPGALRFARSVGVEVTRSRKDA